MERHSAEALIDPERHLGNPINAFLLIKRFTVDWQRIVNNSFPKDDANGKPRVNCSDLNLIQWPWT